MDLYDELRSEFFSNGGHFPDDIVVLEAHNRGLRVELIFVIGDEAMYNAVCRTGVFSFTDCILCKVN
ncbi:hypothetical protein AW729_09455 [Methanosphaera sp. BMS]|nr:hypothetical protein AW729_09455 [Methanosphaera sp. BMS]MBR3213119.1 hypothetical protein [Methanosphaera sp.]